MLKSTSLDIPTPGRVSSAFPNKVPGPMGKRTEEVDGLSESSGRKDVFPLGGPDDGRVTIMAGTGNGRVSSLSALAY